ncbi:hypothetical protein [Helicobacter sp. 13S00401-1]|nr:hypothetical protein [Helicobacter sp. 13S00401-1]
MASFIYEKLDSIKTAFFSVRLPSLLKASFASKSKIIILDT